MVKMFFSFLFNIILIFIISVVNHLSAQGCSDAGFCSIDGIKQNTPAPDSILGENSSSNKNSFKSGVSVGNTRYSVGIVNGYLGYSRILNSSLAISVRLDGQARFGELTQVAGLSDVTLSMVYKLYKSLGIIVGGRIPLSEANNSFEGKSMPMAYQTSLGTYDAIFGAQYFYKNLFFALGWQQPFIQNKNTYRSGSFSDNQLNPLYPETFQFIRSGDILLRISYQHQPQLRMKKYKFTYSLLPIYHLKNDQYTGVDNQIIELKGSQGLTFNTNIYVNYSINPTTSIEFISGFPLIARNFRPEGLSQFAITAEWSKRF